MKYRYEVDDLKFQLHMKDLELKDLLSAHAALLKRLHEAEAKIKELREYAEFH